MAPDLNTVIILQARMGSTRLPGKVMKEIVGKPMLWHIIERLKRIRLKNKVVIATTEDKSDDIIERFCRDNNVECYRGSRDDVLDRYYNAARICKADVIVRATADNPLIDPAVADEVISIYLKNLNRYDIVSNAIRATYPDGVKFEVLSFPCLERCWSEAVKAHQREHVTIYAYENPGSFRLYNVAYKTDVSYMRWTVDNEKDLDFTREVYKRLYREGSIFSMEDVLCMLEKEPSLSKMNTDT